MSKLGTSCKEPQSLYDGFSKPTGVRAIAGDDVMFCLSYCEAANFISNGRVVRTYTPNVPSSTLAINNFRKLHQANQNIWMRTPGDTALTVSSLTYAGTVLYGYVFQNEIYLYPCLVHPAVWVDGAVFN